MEDPKFKPDWLVNNAIVAFVGALLLEQSAQSSPTSGETIIGLSISRLPPIAATTTAMFLLALSSALTIAIMSPLTTQLGSPFRYTSRPNSGRPHLIGLQHLVFLECTRIAHRRSVDCVDLDLQPPTLNLPACSLQRHDGTDIVWSFNRKLTFDFEPNMITNLP